MSSPLRSIGRRQRQTATTTKREIGKRTMKTLLASVAFATAVARPLWVKSGHTTPNQFYQRVTPSTRPKLHD